MVKKINVFISFGESQRERSLETPRRGRIWSFIKISLKSRF
jgi:hypothetical protein